MPMTLLDMLLKAGLITPSQADEALQNKVAYGGKIGTSLIELGFLSEEVLAGFLSKKLMVPYVAPGQLLHIPPDITCLLAARLARKYQVIPCALKGKRLSVAMADPSDLKVVDEIAFITGYIIQPMVAPEIRLAQALERYYQQPLGDRYRRILEEMGKTSTSPSATPPPSPPSPAAAADTTAVSPQQEEEALPDPAVSEEIGPVEEVLEEAEILNDEEWVERLELKSVDSVSEALAKAATKEEIAGILLKYLGGHFDRTALFLVRNQTASGWRAFLRGQEVEDFSMVSIPLTRPSVLKTVAEGKSFYLGPVSETPLNDRMLKGLGGGKPENVLLLPVQIAGRVVTILYVDGGGRPLRGRVDGLRKLAEKVSLAFEVLILRGKVSTS